MSTPHAAEPTGGPDPVQATVTAALLRLQHRKGWLDDQDLRDLAPQLGLPLYRLEEIVSFFPHFRRERPPLVELLVCRDMSCHHAGAPELTATLSKRYDADSRVEIRPVSCLGRCDRPVSACASRFSSCHGGYPNEDVHDAFFHGRDALYLSGVVDTLLAGKPLPTTDKDSARPAPPTPWKIDPYNGTPTYEAAKRAIKQIRQADTPADGRSRLDIIPKLELAGLRGMGGAGAPAAKKWKDVRTAGGSEKYIVCNADESEPATFKDRELMLRAPHLIVEGVILAGLATGASRGYVYIRHEYPEQADAVRRAIASAERERVCGTNVGGLGFDFPVAVYVSPGGYICGEQSALIEAMQGNRAQPRNRPPELATNGLFDKPTLVNNVETFAWTPGIVLHTVLDADPAKQKNWYAELGPAKKGMRFFSISGDVANPGAYEIPIGAPMRTLIEAAGGVIGGEENLLAIAASGPSGGFLPVSGLTRPNNPGEPRDKPRDPLSLLDADLDIDFFRGIPAALGAGLVVFAKGANLPSLAANATEFFRNESCGKCVPCRVGSQKLVEIGIRVRDSRGKPRPDELSADRSATRDLDRALEQTSICGLGQVVSKPLLTLFQYFEPWNKRRATSLVDFTLPGG